MKKLKQLIRQLFCKHKYRFARYKGSTTIYKVCQHCGKGKNVKR